DSSASGDVKFLMCPVQKEGKDEEEVDHDIGGIVPQDAGIEKQKEDGALAHEEFDEYTSVHEEEEVV
ncbi:hypothetical protein KI387_023052, partial [Taxus chinensis]